MEYSQKFCAHVLCRSSWRFLSAWKLSQSCYLGLWKHSESHYLKKEKKYKTVKILQSDQPCVNLASKRWQKKKNTSLCLIILGKKRISVVTKGNSHNLYAYIFFFLLKKDSFGSHQLLYISILTPPFAVGGVLNESRCVVMQQRRPGNGSRNRANRAPTRSLLPKWRVPD